MNKKENHEIDGFLKAMNKKFERRLRNHKQWPRDMLTDDEISLIERL